MRPDPTTLARWTALHPDDPDALLAAAEARMAQVDRTAWLRTAIACMDLTTLSATDDDAAVEALCARALQPGPGLPRVAAVCVYPVFVPRAVAALRGSGVKVATVAGGFPHGQLPLTLRIDEVAWCVDAGADEIDMVISRGRARAGDLAYVADEVEAHREACGDAHLKVILETGELPSDALIARTSRVALEAGAHMIKTSTGKVQPAATPRAAALMLEQLAAFEAETGAPCGFKPAGGLKTPDDALRYLALTAEALGDDAVGPDRLRLGASSLLDALVAALT